MKRRDRKAHLMAEINITPFTDVILVLLIIFMIATPFIYQSSIKVDLPKSSVSEQVSKEIVITVDAQGNVFLENTRLDMDKLKSKILVLLREKKDALVIVNADRNTRYDSVVQVMDALAQVGVRNPGLGVEVKR